MSFFDDDMLLSCKKNLLTLNYIKILLYYRNKHIFRSLIYKKTNLSELIDQTCNLIKSNINNKKCSKSFDSLLLSFFDSLYIYQLNFVK